MFSGGLALLVVLLLYICYQLMLRYGKLLLRVEALERGAALQAPATPTAPDLARGLTQGSIGNDFDLPALSGGRATLSDLQGRPVLLVFVAPNCPHSREALHALVSLPWRGEDDELALLVISTGEPEANRALTEPTGVRAPVLLQEDWEVGELYGTDATPSAYLLDERGAVLRPLAVGTRAVLDLARRALLGEPASATHPAAADSSWRQARMPLGSAAALPPLARGAAAPAFSLPCLQGGERSLADYAGRPLLLVLFDPWCIPCRDLAPELEALHRCAGTPDVLAVSRHDRETNVARAEALGLTTPTVLQHGWELSRRFGVLAAPAAYLIDAAGTIADGPAVGAHEVRALIARVSGMEAPLARSS